jgi:hypothetical protein
MRRSLILLAAVALAGCGGESESSSPANERLPTSAPSLGPGARHRPPSLGARAARALPVRGMRCEGHPRAIYGVHLELFAGRRVVLIPPGIGIAPPRTRDGAYVRGGRCSYPLRTREPTGLIEVGEGNHTLADLFAVWGQPLSRNRMAGFRGRVRAYLGGRRWRRAPRAIPLRRHAQIVLEVGGYVAPHKSYGFPSGL